MPIYAYRCTACGHAKDVLQKMADAPLRVCPACQAETFTKQVTAAGFQLKGSGWYVTDFRGGAGAKAASTSDAAAADTVAKPAEAPATPAAPAKPADTSSSATTASAD
jgi:putative FmdB family regulatory protein